MEDNPMHQWEQSEAGRYLAHLGMNMLDTSTYYALGRAYLGLRNQEFDGSVRQMAEVACGLRYIVNIGERGRQRIAWAIFVTEGVLTPPPNDA